MTENFNTPLPQMEEPKKKSNTTLIIVIVVLLLLCCCVVVVGGSIWYLWENGDQIFGLSLGALNLLI